MAVYRNYESGKTIDCDSKMTWHITAYTHSVLDVRSGFCGKRKWAVRSDHDYLNKNGEWEYEPQPSNRNEEFLARCRFQSFKQAK